MLKRARSGACMNYAGCSLECRVLADRVSFSLICLWFIFHSNFAMCSFKHAASRNLSSLCSCEIKTACMHQIQHTQMNEHYCLCIIRLSSQLCSRTALLRFPFTAVSETFLHKPLSHEDMQSIRGNVTETAPPPGHITVMHTNITNTIKWDHACSLVCRFCCIV